MHISAERQWLTGNVEIPIIVWTSRDNGKPKTRSKIMRLEFREYFTLAVCRFTLDVSRLPLAVSRLPSAVSRFN